ncbi:hypothetical protein STP4a_230 [Salmonella phage STP4-a]|nr:hypothetical protein STP4a_230 [Salmonella phage STP4-a]AHJ86827.1 hypothetical protein STP4a_230 [Salmonella phage STP4-a]
MKENIMARLELDLVCEIIKDEGGMIIDLEFDDCTRFMEILPGKLEFNVIAERGPAGGWPLVEIIGEVEDIREYLEICEYEDIEMYMSDIN